MGVAENNFWPEVQNRIQKEVNRQNYDTWIKPVKLLSVSGSGAVLGVPNRFFKEWLIDHYLDAMTRAFKDVLEKDEVSLSFEIVQDGSEEIGRPEPEAQAKPDTSRPADRQATLHMKYTFDSFVVGPSNQFAHAAAQAVAENPGRAYNPLFVYGGVGLGKTHLLNAICSYIKKKAPGTVVNFLTSEQFTNELITAIHHNRMTEFRNRFRNTDLLVIDDIQFIAGKERTQEEFFHTFNTLHEDFKQIVLSSDRVPKDMPDMEERLRSRFEWGLIADIQPPDLETKAAIVEKKAESEGIKIPKEVAMFLATNIKSNIRELEGSLIRLGAYASLTGREINLELARGVLRDIVTEKENVMGLDQIIKLVADHFHVKVSELKSKRRTRNLVEPRQLAMYICHNIAGASLPEVGRALGGKDHTTVLHACRQVVNKRAGDMKYDAVVDSLIKAVRQ
jgi:chromosomal replication initiator protein